MTKIFVPFQFWAHHRWKDAPENLDYLREYHRHLFICRVELEVNQLDREISFEDVQIYLDHHVLGQYRDRLLEYSCETIADKLIHSFHTRFGARWYSVMVSEDGINGAVVEKDFKLNARVV